MAGASRDWTPERIQHLRTLWAEGHSTEEIGRRMGITKNAVVGKAHRLNLPARPSPIKRQDPRPPRLPRQGRKPSLPPLTVLTLAPPAASVVAPKLAVSALPFKAAVEPARRPAAYSQSARSCCWPIGEPGRPGFHFCGDPVVTPNRPYCDDHCSLAYVKKTVRRRELGEDGYAIA